MFFAFLVAPPPASFLNDIGSYHLRGSDGCSGWKSVWITNKASLFAQYIQFLSSTIIVIMSSMNPCIDASVSVMSTDKGSSVAIWIVECCLTSCVSKYMCGEFRSYVSLDSSFSISFPRCIVGSLTVVYSAGTIIVTKFNRRQRKASLSTISLRVNTVVAFACIQS